MVEERYRKDHFFKDGKVLAMDCKKRCRVGSTCWCFQFVGCVVEFDLATSEGLSTCHHPFQFENYKINCARNSNFHNKKDNGQDVQPTKNKH
jgi:hypothetical protein